MTKLKLFIFLAAGLVIFSGCNLNQNIQNTNNANLNAVNQPTNVNLAVNTNIPTVVPPTSTNCAQIGQAPGLIIKCCSGLILQNGKCAAPPATCIKEGRAPGSSLAKCCADLILQGGICSQPECKTDSDCYPLGFKPGKCGTFYQCKSNKCYSGSAQCPPPACLPNCLGKVCGSDGCNGVCGSCLPPSTCSANGAECLSQPPACTPNCAGKTCGDDGCGGSCGTCASNQTCVSGNCQNCVSHGNLDINTPPRQILIGGSSHVSVMTIKLQASSAEDLYLNEVRVTDTAAITPVASAWYLYASSRSDCGSIADPVAVAPGGVVADFRISDTSVTIPHGGSVTLVVKIDVINVDGSMIQNGLPFYPWVAASGDVMATGKYSGQHVNIITAPLKAEGPDHVYGSRPYFSVDASSPGGALIPSSNAQLAIFDVSADAANDITFSHSAGNKLVVGVNRSCVGSVGTVFLKDGDGNILDSQAGVDLCAVSSLTFTFSSRDLIIAKGTTKKLYVYGNTSGFINHGDLIQLWLDPSLTTNVTWSINSDGGNYGEADIIFRGGIYANSLSKS
ncbi:MAG: hypothetical protein PHC97_04135 [Patescibacteria group bacterium]|nr:hypothetical protein [Patescibacteria group bacterium]